MEQTLHQLACVDEPLVLKKITLRFQRVNLADEESLVEALRFHQHVVFAIANDKIANTLFTYLFRRGLHVTKILFSSCVIIQAHYPLFLMFGRDLKESIGPCFPDAKKDMWVNVALFSFQKSKEELSTLLEEGQLPINTL